MVSRSAITTAIAALCLCLTWSFAVAAAPVGEVFTQTRPFQGLIRRDMAQAAARTAAELDAFHHAMRLLAQGATLQTINETGKAGQHLPPDVAGLARIIYSTRLTAEGIQGFPPAVEAVVRVTLAPPQDTLREAVITALSHPANVELAAKALARQEELLTAYDKQSLPLLTLTPEAGGKKIELFALQNLLKAMQAIDLYLALLPERTGIWNNPQATQAKLARILELDPNSPLTLTALAEVSLQRDRPADALEYAASAINHDPTLYFAHDVKGAAFLRQRLPAMAARSFGEAIEIAPHIPELYTHRAAAFLVQEETAAMCADFHTACALGDCAGYLWARSSGKCSSPPAKQETTSAPAISEPLTSPPSNATASLPTPTANATLSPSPSADVSLPSLTTQPAPSPAPTDSALSPAPSPAPTAPASSPQRRGGR